MIGNRHAVGAGGLDDAPGSARALLGKSANSSRNGGNHALSGAHIQARRPRLPANHTAAPIMTMYTTTRNNIAFLLYLF